MSGNFDDLLSAAFSEAFDEEIKAVEQMKKVKPSKQLKGVVLGLCKKEKPRAVWHFQSALKRCAVFVLVFFSTASLLMLTAPEVRAAVRSVLTVWTKEAVIFFFDKDSADKNFEVIGIEAEYIPIGFSVSDAEIDLPSYYYKEWSNLNQERIILECVPISSSGNYGYDQEHGTKEEIALDKDDLLFLKSTDSRYPHHLSWTEKDYLVTLALPYGFMDGEIIKMVENIQFIVKEN